MYNINNYSIIPFQQSIELTFTSFRHCQTLINYDLIEFHYFDCLFVCVNLLYILSIPHTSLFASK